MIVGEIMSSPVVAVSPESSLYTVVEKMVTNKVGSVLVIDDGLVGIVTRSDILRAVYYLDDSVSDLLVSDAMSEDMVTIERTASISKALQKMETHSIKKLPVVEDFDVVGIVTVTDIADHQPDRVREVRESLERKDEWTK